MLDNTCKGRLEFALRHDAPEDGIRRDLHGKRLKYFVGAFDDGYFVACASHHIRYDRGWL